LPTFDLMCIKAKVFSLFLILFAVNTFAQKADSLEIVLSKTKADSSKSILLSLLSDELTKSNPAKAVESARKGLKLAKQISFEKGVFENYFSLAATLQGQALFDSAIIYYRKALGTAKIRKDIVGQAEVCSGLGHSFMRKSQMDSSRYYLEMGLALAKQINNYKIEAGIYNNYGNIFLEESSYQKALDYFVRAAKLYENPLADEYGQCLALSNIGNIEYRLGNFDKALGYAHQSMVIAKRKSFTSSIGYAHKLLGRIYKKQLKYDSALHEYKQAQKLYLTLGDTRSAGELLQNIGNVYFDKKQYQDALNNYLQSLKLAKSISVKPLVAYAYSAIGQAYAILKKNNEALLYLDSSRVAAMAIGNKYLVMDSYNAMSSVHEAKGDYKKALMMHQRFVDVKDSITQSENRQLAEDTQAKYELEKKEAKIVLLEKEQELKTLALARQRAIQIGAVIAALLAIIIATLLVNRYRINNKAKRQTEIEQVRNNIARDLHDDIGSTLSTINIISNIAMRENSTGNNLHLSHIAEQSSRMMESMSDMVWSINPINDSMEKVVVKMKVFASEILEPKNIAFQFLGEESLSELSLDAEKRKNLFLIFKESINNAAKYSSATEIGIALKKIETKLSITISDNGIGFEDQYVKSGNGLKNMEARAKALGGNFKLSSVVGLGTRIEVEMPIT
jgi:two-component system, NarL family, sensor histidine kinase UhpB